MADYAPPAEDMLLILFDVLGFAHAEIDRDTARSVLEEAAKLATEVLAPLNHPGDKTGAKLENGKVTTAPGFKEAYAQYCAGGWNAVPFDPEYGGQGLPWALAFCIQEMWQGANMAFGLCPLLNQGAVEAIALHGSDAQRQKYLPKLIAGEWTGTMNLTESQAGSDIGLIRTKAEKQVDGTYKITGQKIFITYGEHDMADNIIHLVLARTPDGPEDVKGISLFIVPKIMDNGSRNHVTCIGLEHKLGIHASPTCTMEFDGAIGTLIGQENMGLKYMFTMMNNARLCVGLQGVAIAERAYQKANAFANERIQGKSLKTGQRVVIAEHADVRRMLRTMKTKIETGRALTLEAAFALDRAAAGDEEAQKKVEFLTPIVKSWCTDMACEVTSMALQVFGGMGFIEETGIAQLYRDARILPIYEGTNGIQAADLVFRKIVHDEGRTAKTYIESLANDIPADSLEKLTAATQKLLEWAAAGEMDRIAAVSSAYLNAFALIAGSAQLVKIRAARRAAGEGPPGGKPAFDPVRDAMLPHAQACLVSMIGS